MEKKYKISLIIAIILTLILTILAFFVSIVPCQKWVWDNSCNPANIECPLGNKILINGLCELPAKKMDLLNNYFYMHLSSKQAILLFSLSSSIIIFVISLVVLSIKYKLKNRK